MNYYIAFSIAGTNCFITATTHSTHVATNSPGFKVGKSRRDNYNKHSETKIVWDKLNKKNGQPHTTQRRGRGPTLCLLRLPTA